jgi:hypothetical protein
MCSASLDVSKSNPELNRISCLTQLQYIANEHHCCPIKTYTLTFNMSDMNKNQWLGCGSLSFKRGAFIMALRCPPCKSALSFL